MSVFRLSIKFKGPLRALCFDATKLIYENEDNRKTLDSNVRFVMLKRLK